MTAHAKTVVTGLHSRGRRWLAVVLLLQASGAAAAKLNTLMRMAIQGGEGPIISVRRLIDTRAHFVCIKNENERTSAENTHLQVIKRRAFLFSLLRIHHKEKHGTIET